MPACRASRTWGLGGRSGVELLGDSEGIADDGAFITVRGDNHMDLITQMVGGMSKTTIGDKVTPDAIDQDLPLVM